jgi:hypothetical protein
MSKSATIAFSVRTGQEKTPPILPFAVDKETDQRPRVCRRDAPGPTRFSGPKGSDEKKRGWEYQHPLSSQWLLCKELVNNSGWIDRRGQIDHVLVMGEQ